MCNYGIAIIAAQHKNIAMQITAKIFVRHDGYQLHIISSFLY